MMARINNAQARVLTTVLNDGRQKRLLEGEAVASATDRPAVYTLAGLLDDLRRGIWSEVYADRSIDAGAAPAVGDRPAAAVRRREVAAARDAGDGCGPISRRPRGGPPTEPRSFIWPAGRRIEESLDPKN